MPHDTIDLTPITKAGVELDQYFGLWAVAEEQFLALFNRVAQLNLAAHIQVSAGTVEAAQKPQVTNARKSEAVVGVIEIAGTLTKRGSSLSRASSLVALQRAVRAAARDPEIDAILLRIDSPGGTVAGTQELAAEVKRASETKPVYAYIDDLAASAAYWIASQTERIYANTPTAIVGSIGTFVGLYDYSAYAAKEGIRAVVIKAGALKAAGFPGTEITDEQKAYWQEIVDQTQEQFTAGVASGRGRGVDEVREKWVTGRVYMAQESVAMGLIDGIKSFEAVISELMDLVNQARKPSKTRSNAMSETQNITTETQVASPRAATIAELKAACAGADAGFLVTQLEAGATIGQAQAAWIAEQQKRLEAAEKAKIEAEAKIKEAEAKATAPGVEALGDSKAGPATESADPVAEWHQAIAAKEKAGLERPKAIAVVVHEQPELHQAYLDAVNAKRK